MFSCEFCEISKNTFFTEHLQTTASDYLLGLCNIYVNKELQSKKIILFPVLNEPKMKVVNKMIEVTVFENWNYAFLS